MVHNRAHDRLRERARVREEGRGWFEVAELSDHTLQLLVHEALERLSPAQREVVVLHSIVGLTFREVAAALTIPAPTAASRYRAALERMKAMLVEEGS